MRTQSTHNRLLSLLLALALAFVFNFPAQAQSPQPVEVRVAPAAIQVAVGQEVDVAVEVVNVQNLYGIDILLAFDPQTVEVVDMDPTLDDIQVSLGTLLEPGFVILNLVDNSLGRLRLVMTQLNPATPKSGTGTLVVVRLKGKQPGPPGAVQVLAAKLAGPQGENIPTGPLTPGQVQVVQTLSGPTQTPIPAQDPGTPMPTPVPPTAVSNQPAQAATATAPLLNVLPTAIPTLVLPTAAPTQVAAAADTPPPATLTPAVDSQVVPPTSATQDSQPTPIPGADTAADSTSAPLPEEPAGSPAWLFGLLALVILAGAGAYLLWRRRPPGGS